MEQNRKVWNTLETTVSYKAWARLTPTLTHVVTYELVTSGAEDRAMSQTIMPGWLGLSRAPECPCCRRNNATLTGPYRRPLGYPAPMHGSWCL